VDNLDVAARALLISEGSGNDLGNAMLAARLAPDLPVARVALARAFWSEGEYVSAGREAVEGLLAIPRNLEASFWLTGSLVAVIAVVLVAGSLFFMVILGLSSFARAAHDLGDLLSRDLADFARAALVGCLLLLPLVLGEGLAGLALACFALAFVYGTARHRMALLLAAALLIIGLFPLARTAGRVLDAMESDALASAALAVVEGEETPEQVALLKAAAGEEILAEHILAMRARRGGRVEEARVRYEALLRSRPRDPVVLNNYANLRFGAGDSEGALDLYEQSASLADSAILMFNLSQAYARLFRIEEFEHTLKLAQSIDADFVADLSRFGDSNLVADLPFPRAEIRARLLGNADGEGYSRLARKLFAPGLLGVSWVHTVAGFAGLAIVAVLLAGRFDRASRCSHCGRRICARCDGIFWNSETCDGCHHLFNQPESTDPSMRMARLAQLRLREERQEKIATAVSLVVPGAAGLLARRPDLSFVGIVLFAAGVTLFAWRGGVVPDPLVVGGAGPLFFVIAGSAALAAYCLVVMAGILIRRNA
jgi:tetratricopeptide (TPR) repeat protein